MLRALCSFCMMISIISAKCDLQNAGILVEPEGFIAFDSRQFLSLGNLSFSLLEESEVSERSGEKVARSKLVDW